MFHNNTSDLDIAAVNYEKLGNKTLLNEKVSI